MNATSASRKTIHHAAAVGGLIVALALTGCQSAAVGSAMPAPAARQTHHFPTGPKAPVGVDSHRSADRVAEDIERIAEHNRELSARFAGVPADRVEEQLAREAADAQTGK